MQEKLRTRLTANFDVNKQHGYKKWGGVKNHSVLPRSRHLDHAGIEVESDTLDVLSPSVRMSMVIGGGGTAVFGDKSVIHDHPSSKKESWEYPGFGGVYSTTLDVEKLPHIPHKHQLDLFRATSIAGNDLLASVLYTTGLCAAACGQLAPIAMIITCLALYPFRKIFQECGTALPLNGGVYVAMLNSSSKLFATFAASCSLISYSATAVVSAASCTAYAASEFGDFPQLPATIGIMAFFAMLVLGGVKDSANVAMTIFSIHLLTLAVLVVSSLKSIGEDGGEMLRHNWHDYELPISESGGIGADLLYGFSVSLLGLTGFETCANFIEEAGPFETETEVRNSGKPRKVSVFEKTMTNMYLLVCLVNPTIAFVTLGVVDLPTITGNASIILSVLGERSGGSWLRLWVAIDAILVLSGGVLTAFVGVTGIIKQLSEDRCLPSFLLKKNSFAGTYHYIILGFFLLCTTLYLITGGDIVVLSGVFAVAFLMVMITFALANMKLKFNRSRLPRGAKISWAGAVFGFAAMSVGLIGNIVYNDSILYYFLVYLCMYFTAIVLTFERVPILRLLIYFCDQSKFLKKHLKPHVVNAIISSRSHTVVFFAKTSEIGVLNKAVKYTHDNELCDHLIVCHVNNPRQEYTGNEVKRGVDGGGGNGNGDLGFLQMDGIGLALMDSIGLDAVGKAGSSSSGNVALNMSQTGSPNEFDDSACVERLRARSNSVGKAGSSNSGNVASNMSQTGSPNEFDDSARTSTVAPRLSFDAALQFDKSLQRMRARSNSKDRMRARSNSNADFSYDVSHRMQENLRVLDHLYPKMKIDLLLVNAEEFCPRVVQELSKDLGIPASFMFIRCPGSTFRYNIGSFGGVRTIMQ